MNKKSIYALLVSTSLFAAGFSNVPKNSSQVEFIEIDGEKTVEISPLSGEDLEPIQADSDEDKKHTFDARSNEHYEEGLTKRADGTI